MNMFLIIFIWNVMFNVFDKTNPFYLFKYVFKFHIITHLRNKNIEQLFHIHAVWFEKRHSEVILSQKLRYNGNYIQEFSIYHQKL